RHVYGQFLAYCRDALHLALGGDPGQVDLPAEEAAALAETARAAGCENLLRLVHQLLQSEATVRRSETGALAVEIAWLRAAELPKLRRVEELLARNAVAAAPRGGAAPRPRPAPRPARAPRPRPPAPRRSARSLSQDSTRERAARGVRRSGAEPGSAAGAGRAPARKTSGAFVRTERGGSRS